MNKEVDIALANALRAMAEEIEQATVADSTILYGAIAAGLLVWMSVGALTYRAFFGGTFP